ncbi:hypothetical protein D8674_015574 [Pyrus ussuriensis x Pyrus communis]|uniref:Uncharacterized protein n=1 Tax=Pyrus ussuriensis x Pyrus communis TaxID=2448454 RepID=A0A5N5GVR3_9ROSA|nr:hypothetical protein D8674_015574 [Pyrus ussuriensis x Pyrus communis]
MGRETISRVNNQAAAMAVVDKGAVAVVNKMSATVVKKLLLNRAAIAVAVTKFNSCWVANIPQEDSILAPGLRAQPALYRFN